MNTISEVTWINAARTGFRYPPAPAPGIHAQRLGEIGHDNPKAPRAILITEPRACKLGYPDLNRSGQVKKSPRCYNGHGNVDV